MVVMNAIIIDPELLKILNIILNASTGLILSLIANFKIYENIQAFHQLQIKFNKRRMKQISFFGKVNGIYFCHTIC